LAQYNNLRPYF